MNKKLNYRLITGKDDATFCERISKLIGDGYKLYGSPSITYNGKDVIAAQAVILPEVLKLNKHNE
ncbi:MAG: DUF1737 domain-containing protein [Desulfobacteraceae bacterium]|nr:DUF1737 domain-containing protein [Desulfobacteraceae bacterium]